MMWTDSVDVYTPPGVLVSYCYFTEFNVICLSGQDRNTRVKMDRIQAVFLCSVSDWLSLLSTIIVAASPSIPPVLTVDPPLLPRDLDTTIPPPYLDLHLSVRYLAFAKAKIINTILHCLLALLPVS